METMDVVCAKCGYDFPAKESTEPKRRHGFAYSGLADLALIVSTIAAVLSVLITVYIGIVALSYREWLTALVICPIAFLLQVGMLVVFLRVQDQ